MKSPLKIIIEAAVVPGGEGGIEQVLIGLVNGLGKLVDGDEKYVIVVAPCHRDWLAPYCGSNQEIVEAPAAPTSPLEPFKRALGPLRRPLGELWRRLRGSREVAREDSLESDGFYETLGGDVLHITYPLRFVSSAVPTVFTVYDLQQRHYPAFFSADHLAWRERIYSRVFKEARALPTISQWVRQDTIRQYGVEPSKLVVIPLAPVTETYGETGTSPLSEDLKAFRLPAAYAFFPAMTCEHKNHTKLLEALALLRDRDKLRIELICSGATQLFWPQVRRKVNELRLNDQVRFLGFVSPCQMRTLYRGARFLVFPSLFEGAGMPVMEAFREGTAVVCSDLPPIREYAGDAPLYFDPRSVESMARQIKAAWTDRKLCESIVEKGRYRAQRLTWMASARKYRALYRKVGGRGLTQDDIELLHDDRVLGELSVR